MMQGGSIPPEYLELILMRDLGIKPWEIDRLTSEQLNNFIACLQGEAKAQRVQSRMASSN